MSMSVSRIRARTEANATTTTVDTVARASKDGVGRSATKVSKSKFDYIYVEESLHYETKWRKRSPKDHSRSSIKHESVKNRTVNL